MDLKLRFLWKSNSDLSNKVPEKGSMPFGYSLKKYENTKPDK